MTFTKPALPHQAYRTVLMDFREQLFHRFFWLTIAVLAITADLALFQQPRAVTLIGVLTAFAVMFACTYRLFAIRPYLSRYLFVISLYIALIALIHLQVASWTVYLIMPIMLMSALLMSNSAWIGGSIFLVYYLLIAQYQIDVPVESVIAYTLISGSLILITIANFNVTLSWYSSMHDQADALLKETRDRRAELVRTLKSLDTAYQTQRRLQQQLIYARQQAEEARRLKERFASNISHELRTPLNIILGFSEIMHLTPEIYGEIIFPPKLHRDIYQIHHNSKHLLAMIDDVLDLSQIELSTFSLNFESTEMTQFLNDAVLMMTPQFDNSPIQFIVDIADELPVLEIDRTRIRQVFINLMTNAHRFTDSGYVKFTALAKKDSVDLIIEDTGRGITEDQLKLIFEEFYQVDYSLSREHGGAGLGLAITKQFVEAHNGTLHVDSRFGEGSTFVVSLPLPEQQSPRFTSDVPKSSKVIEENHPALVIGADTHTMSLLSRHLPDLHLVAVEAIDDLQDCILEYHPLAIIHNRFPHDEAIDSLSVPIIECSLPGGQWLTSQLDVDMSISKPITAEQIESTVAQYSDVQKLLIVDDNIGFVQLMHRSIERLSHPYDIRRAYDGQQACDIIQQDPPDLIFLDLSMPEVGGIEVIEFIHEHQLENQIHIVLLTATRYLQSDDEWYSHVHVHKKGGFNTRQTLHHLKAILSTM